MSCLSLVYLCKIGVVICGEILYNIVYDVREERYAMLRLAAVILFSAVLMVLTFPLCAAAEGADSVNETESSRVSSENSSEGDEKSGGDWKIFVSIGAGIAVVAVVIGIIASKDA